MRKELKIQPLVYPLPVILIATYNEDGSVDVMNAAWGCAGDFDKVLVVLDPAHKTCANFKRTGSFTISLATSRLVAESDWFGIGSSNTLKDKFERTGLRAERASTVDAPVLLDFPLSMECEFLSMDDDTGITLGLIKKVTADESCVDGNGVFQLEKADAVLLDGASHRYFKVGDPFAQAFSIGKKFK